MPIHPYHTSFLLQARAEPRVEQIVGAIDLPNIDIESTTDVSGSVAAAMWSSVGADIGEGLNASLAVVASRNFDIIDPSVHQDILSMPREATNNYADAREDPEEAIDGHGQPKLAITIAQMQFHSTTKILSPLVLNTGSFANALEAGNIHALALAENLNPFSEQDTRPTLGWGSNDQVYATNDSGNDAEEPPSNLDTLSMATSSFVNSSNVGRIHGVVRPAVPVVTRSPFLSLTALDKLADNLIREYERREALLTFAPRLAPVSLPAEYPETTISLNPLLRSPRVHGASTRIEWTLSQPALGATVSSSGGYSWWNRPATRPGIESMTLCIEGHGRPVIVFPRTPENRIIQIGDVLQAVESAVAPDGVRRNYGIGARWGGLYRSPDESDMWVAVICGW